MVGSARPCGGHASKKGDQGWASVQGHQNGAGDAHGRAGDFEDAVLGEDADRFNTVDKLVVSHIQSVLLLYY